MLVDVKEDNLGAFGICGGDSALFEGLSADSLSAGQETACQWYGVVQVLV